MKLLFFSFFLRLFSCGQILFWDFQLDFTNIGYTTQYTFIFSLETALLTSNYLKLVLPYNLHSSVSNNIPNNIQATIKTFASDPCSSFTSQQPSLYYYSSPPGYYIQFTQGLQPQTAYSLTLSLTTPVSGVLPVLYSALIEIYTVSSIDSNQIIYDSNDLFCNLAHTAAPSSNLNGALGVTSGNMLTLGALYPILLTLYPQQTVKGSSRILLTLTDNRFLFQGPCSLVSGLDSFGNSINPTNLYSCTVDSSQNMVKMTIFSDVPSSLVIKVWVQNPIRVVSGVYVTAMVLMAYENHIVMQKTFSTYALSTSPLSVKASRLVLAWGMNYLQNMAPSQNLILVRGDFTWPSAYVYNSLRIYFSFSLDFPDNIELQLNLNLKTNDITSPGSYVLEGSIVENLPGFSSSSPRCYMLNNDQSSLTNYRQLICDKVGKLQANIDYFIGFRLYLVYDATTSNLPSDFSTLTVYTKTLNTVDANPILSSVVLVTSSISTINNKNWLYVALQNTVVTTQLSSQSLIVKPEVSSSTTLGLQYLSTNDKQRMVFHLYVPATDATATAFPLSTDTPNTVAITNSAGLYIVMNPSLQFDSNPPVLENTASDTSYTTVSLIEVSQTKTVVRIAGSQTIALQNCYTNAYANRFSLKSVVIPFTNSYYADNLLLDFYFYSFDQILSPNPTLLAFFFANAYVISTPKPNYLYFSMVNYYNGATVNNDGTYLPTILRVYGFLRNSDVLNKTCQRLAFFFDYGLEFYRNTADPFDYSIACSSSYGNANCYGYDNTRQVTEVQVYNNLKRVEVDFSTSVPTETANSFELLIPVQTVMNFYKLTLFMSPLIYHTTIPNQRYFQPVCSYRLTGDASLLNTNQLIDFTSLYSGNTVALTGTYAASGISNIVYGWSSSDTLTVGSIKTLLKVSATHQESPTMITPNSNLPSSSSNGAGFTMNLLWNFTTPSLLFSWSNTGVNPSEKCLIYKYNRGSSNWRYGFFCPFQSGTGVSGTSAVNISNFYITNSNGIQIPSYTCFGYSKNSGALASVATLSGNTLSAGVITPGYFVVLPIFMKMYQNSVLLNWNVTLMNPLVNNMKIILTFNSSLQFSVGSTCYLKNSKMFQTATCTASLVSGNKLQFLVSNCLDCPYAGGTYIIYHYGNNAPQVTYNPQNVGSYVHLLTSIVTLLSSGTLVDSTSNSLSLSQLISYDYSTTSIANFSASSQAIFSYPQQNAYSNVSFMFGPTNRGIYASETVVINLGTLATTNQNNPEIQCSVFKDQSLQVEDNRFYSMGLSTLSQITLRAAVDITAFNNNPNFWFHCRNVQVPAMTQVDLNISIGLKDSLLATVIQAFVDVSCPNFTISLAFNTSESLSINKVWNILLLKTEVFFNFTANVTINMNSMLFVSFPSYYLPHLTRVSENLYCEVEGQPVNCAVYSQRQVLISSFPNVIAALTNFALRIQGVQTPNVFTNPGNFIISFANSLDFLLKYGQIQDVLPTSSIQVSNLQILNFSIASGQTFIRQNSQYSISFMMPNYMAQQSNAIVIDLPSEWDFLLEISSNLSCSCLNATSGFSNNLLLNFTKVNNQIRANFSINSTATIDDPSQSNLVFIINGIYNPMEVVCKPNKLSVAIIVAGSLNYFSGYSTMNVPQNFSFGLSPYLEYVEMNSQAFNDNSTNIDLYLGVLSDEITFNLYSSSNQSRKFTYPLQININKAGFSTLPDNIFIPSGASNVKFRVFNLSNVLPGVFPLQFIKTSDPFNQYGDLPLLIVNLRANYPKINILTGNSYSIPMVLSGLSGLVILDTGDYIANNFTLQAWIEDPSLNITFYDGSYQTNIDFNWDSINLGSTSRAFMLKLSYLNASLTSSQTRVIFNFSSSVLLTPPDPITVGLTQDLTGNPDFLMATPSFTTESTIVPVIMNCDQNGVIYYSISTINSLSQVPETIKKEAWNFTSYQSSTRQQYQYGLVIINDTNNGYNFTYNISNLMSNTSYRILGFCANQANIMSVSIMQSFTTKWNGGYLQKITFNYQTPLNKSQIEGLICYLNYYFGFSNSSITSKESFYCSNITRISGYFESNFNQNSPQSNFLSIYFLPDLNKETDSVTSVVAALSNDITYLYYSVQKYVPFLPALVSLGYPQTVPSTSPAYDPFLGVSVNFEVQNNSQVYINVAGLSLVQTGFIYLAISQDGQGFQPSFDELRLCSNSKFIACVMDLKNGEEQMSWNFTNLSNNTLYYVFYAASEENPGPFSNYIDVSVVTVNTTINTANESGRKHLGMLLFVLLYVVFLMVV